MRKRKANSFTTLRGDGLVKIYRGRQVVRGVSLEVKVGEIVGLLGPNGAGKTTTFYMLTGLVTPNRGNIFLDDRRITKMSMYKRSRWGIGYLPQEPSIFRRLSVAENILLILEFQKLSRKERFLRMETLLEEFQIQGIAGRKGYVLSGGERRRVEIARALATNPRFLLLDEPFTGIDPIAVEELQGIMRRLKEKGIGILITDHNVRETLEITDRAYITYDGRVLKSGSPSEIAADPESRRLYLGERFKVEGLQTGEEAREGRPEGG